MRIRPSYAFYLSLTNNTFTALEVGVREGYNARQMMTLTDRLEKLILVDNYIGEFEKFEVGMLARLKPYWDRCVYHKLDSISASKLIKDNSIDYLYIDGDHDELPVAADIEAWYPKVKTGGLMAGHDWWSEQVKKSVLTFAATKKARLFACQNMFSGIPINPYEGEFMDWWFLKQERRKHED